MENPNIKPISETVVLERSKDGKPLMSIQLVEIDFSKLKINNYEDLKAKNSDEN